MATSEKSVGGCVASNSGDATVPTPTSPRLAAQPRESVDAVSASRLLYSLSQRVESTLDEGDLVSIALMAEHGRHLIEHVAQTAQGLGFIIAADDDHPYSSGAFNGKPGSHALYLLGEMAELAHTCLVLADEAEDRLMKLRGQDRLVRRVA